MQTQVRQQEWSQYMCSLVVAITPEERAWLYIPIFLIITSKPVNKTPLFFCSQNHLQQD